MKFSIIFLAFILGISSCSSPEANQNEEVSTDSNTSEQEPAPEDSPFASYEFRNDDFGSNPFATQNPKIDLLKTAYIRIDTSVVNNRSNPALKDSIFNFRYDDASEIALYSINGRQFIAFAALVSNILPLKNDVAIGMDKNSFWKSFSELEGVDSHYNIMRITNDDKIKWVGIQFQDDIFKLMEYRGSLD